MLVIAALIAPLLTVAAAGAQVAQGECRRGVLVEARCVSVDGRPPTCEAASPCVEFLFEATPRCPDGATFLGEDNVEGPCELRGSTTPRSACVAGTRGEPGSCFIYVAVSADGCPSNSTVDAAGNCRRPVADVIFDSCEPPAQYEAGECVTFVDLQTPGCPTDASRFDDACWRLTNATAPAMCPGAPAVRLASGLCREPLPIPTGPATCDGGAVYVVAPGRVVLDSAENATEAGESFGACVDETADIVRFSAFCTFFDDDYEWMDVGDGRCTREAPPTVATCPAGYSFDDFVAGQCGQVVPEVGGLCLDDAMPYFGDTCLVVVPYAEFECPAGMEPIRIVSCFATRAWQTLIGCGSESVLLPRLGGNGYGCNERIGPQPDVCNGEGGLEDCHVIFEPSPVLCLLGGGCLVTQDIAIPGDVDCDGDITIIDALMIAQFTAFTRGTSGTCISLDASSELFDRDGDLNADGFVDIIDALLAAQCDAGLPVFEGCAQG